MLFQTKERVESSFVSGCISLSTFLCEYEKSALFSPDLAVTWEFFCPVTFLFVHQSACFMNVLQSLYLYLKKKKKLPKDFKIQGNA